MLYRLSKTRGTIALPDTTAALNSAKNESGGLTIVVHVFGGHRPEVVGVQGGRPIVGVHGSRSGLCTSAAAVFKQSSSSVSAARSGSSDSRDETKIPCCRSSKGRPGSDGRHQDGGGLSVPLSLSLQPF